MLFIKHYPAEQRPTYGEPFDLVTLRWDGKRLRRLWLVLIVALCGIIIGSQLSNMFASWYLVSSTSYQRPRRWN